MPEALGEPRVDVTEEQGGTVARLVLTAPGGNALDLVLLQDLQRAVEAISGWPSLVAIVMEGSGRDFSTGIPELHRRLPFLGPVLSAFHEVARSLLSLDVLWISLIRGRCQGAGAALALAADLVVADGSAKLTLVERDETPPLTEIVVATRLDRGQALHTLLSSKTYTAEEAAELRLVSDLAKGWEAGGEMVQRHIRHLVAGRPRAAIGHVVRTLRAPLVSRVAELLPDLERETIERLSRMPGAEQTLAPKWRPGS